MITNAFAPVKVQYPQWMCPPLVPVRKKKRKKNKTEKAQVQAQPCYEKCQVRIVEVVHIYFEKIHINFENIVLSFKLNQYIVKLRQPRPKLSKFFSVSIIHGQK